VSATPRTDEASLQLLNPAPTPPTNKKQRDLLELLYRCARNGRLELHTRFMPEPAVAAAFDELLEKDAKVWLFNVLAVG